MTSNKEHDARVRETLQLMHERALLAIHDPAIRDDLSYRIAELNAMGELDEEALLRALCEGLARKLTYKKEPRAVPRELHLSPGRTLLQGCGDADDLATLVAVFLKVLGFPVKFRATRAPGRPYFHSVHVLAGLPREAPTKWIPIDLSAPRENVYDNPVASEEHLDV